MIDLKIGTYPPMFPRSLFLEKQIKPALEGKRIEKTCWERYHTGKYSWHGDLIPGFEELSGHTILFADASFALTDKGALIFYSYMDGDLRYFPKGDAVRLQKTTKSTSHGYHAKIFLEDGSCLGVNQYGWGTLLKVFKVDLKLVHCERTGKYGRYPFLPKGPIDVTDEEAFTYAGFRKRLLDNPGANVVESCATAKGALRIENPVMNHILLISNIHPRTKTRMLSEGEMRTIFDNTLRLVKEYKSGARVSRHTDIFGNVILADHDILWMTSAVLGAPCPVCGSPIEAVPAAGTKMYFCPTCQVVKK